MFRKLGVPLAVLFVAGACVGPTGETDPGLDEDLKEDSGWLSNTSFEVDVVVHGEVQVRTTYEWAEIASDPGLQMALIDLQVKFAKNQTEDREYRINQLVDSVDSVEVTVEGDLATLVYAATVDMVREHDGDVPTLDELEERTFPVLLPLNPTTVYNEAGTGCSNDSSHVSGYNYPYYFDPDQPNCDIEIVETQLEIVEVFERSVVFPEYDQLLVQREDGSVGFDMAIVPAEGDQDPMGRLMAHHSMLETMLGLEAWPSDDGAYLRYEWERDGVLVIIDLFNPTEGSFTESFQAALSEYDVVYYNGHSAYGTQQLLTNPAAFSESYQIIGLHSCQSYAYYVQQAFRAKATEEDPEGEALTDFVATGQSSRPSDSPLILLVLLRRLMDGVRSINSGAPENAPDWLSIVTEMNSQVSGINYGIAGVRNNAWHPPQP